MDMNRIDDNVDGFNDIVLGVGSLMDTPISDTYSIKKLAGHITCKDGTTLSVQASSMHYCRPRDNDGPYSHVEVGFPSIAPPETWREYYDGNWTQENATESVYGYIPVELVHKYIESHGGEA